MAQPGARCKGSGGLPVTHIMDILMAGTGERAEAVMHRIAQPQITAPSPKSNVRRENLLTIYP